MNPRCGFAGRSRTTPSGAVPPAVHLLLEGAGAVEDAASAGPLMVTRRLLHGEGTTRVRAPAGVQRELGRPRHADDRPSSRRTSAPAHRRAASPRRRDRRRAPPRVRLEAGRQPGPRAGVCSRTAGMVRGVLDRGYDADRGRRGGRSGPGSCRGWARRSGRLRGGRRGARRGGSRRSVPNRCRQPGQKTTGTPPPGGDETARPDQQPGCPCVFLPAGPVSHSGATRLRPVTGSRLSMPPHITHMSRDLLARLHI